MSRNLLNLSIYSRKILSFAVCRITKSKDQFQFFRTPRTMIIIDSNETMHLRGNEIHEDW